MSLIVPQGPSWSRCSHNISGTPAFGGIGTSITSGASNADGSAVTVLSALAHDVEYLRLGFSGETITTAVDNTALVTILIDPAGGTSWATLIPSLLVAVTTPAAATPYALWFDFPLWIPAGASIGAQARSAAAATPPVMRLFAQAYGGNRNPTAWWAGQRVTAIGIDAANSRGTTHTPGNTGSFSSWTDFGSTISADAKALQWAVSGTFNSTGWNQVIYQFEFGVASAIIGPPIMHSCGSAETAWSTHTGPLFKVLPSGTQLQVRATSNTTSQAQGVAAYAVH